MLTPEQKIKDYGVDEVYKLLKKFHAVKIHKGWNKQKHDSFKRLEEGLKRNKYMQFIGDSRNVLLSPKGENCLYDVDNQQRGYLSKFRNKRIRIISLGATNKYNGRLYAVKKVSIVIPH